MLAPYESFSKVLLSDEEVDDITCLAQRKHSSVGELVRRTLSQARSDKSRKDPKTELKAVRSVGQCSLAVADLDHLLREMERDDQ
jgi:hypothetical protein